MMFCSISHTKMRESKITKLAGDDVWDTTSNYIDSINNAMTSDLSIVSPLTSTVRSLVKVVVKVC